MRFRLNGAEVEYSGPADRTLLVFLREERGLRSLKNGCSEGACGCCTVQLGARAVLACRTPMNRVDGREVRTLEGFTERQRAVFARAFLLTGGVQCGFCTPGIVVRVKVLLDHHPDPRPEEVREALAPHLCRCTGYVKIVEAALLAARLLREGGDLPEVSAEGFIGIFLPRYQGEALVLGERAFVRDLKVPGMLHGALRLADHPRAVVRQLRLSPAFTVEGVRRIFTAQDVPGERLVGSIVRDWPVFVAEGELTRCVGDVLAGVVATSEEAARRAAAQGPGRGRRLRRRRSGRADRVRLPDTTQLLEAISSGGAIFQRDSGETIRSWSLTFLSRSVLSSPSIPGKSSCSLSLSTPAWTSSRKNLSISPWDCASVR